MSITVYAPHMKDYIIPCRELVRWSGDYQIDLAIALDVWEGLDYIAQSILKTGIFYVKWHNTLFVTEDAAQGRLQRDLLEINDKIYVRGILIKRIEDNNVWFKLVTEISAKEAKDIEQFAKRVP